MASTPEKPPRVIFSEMVQEYFNSVGRTPQIGQAAQLRRARLDFEAELAIARQTSKIEAMEEEKKKAKITAIQSAFNPAFDGIVSPFVTKNPEQPAYPKQPAFGPARERGRPVRAKQVAAIDDLEEPPKRLIQI